MVVRSDKGRLALPLRRIEKENFTADVLDITRTFATLYDGSTIVDEKITMPANYTFGKAPEGLLTSIFPLKSIRRLKANDRMALYRGFPKDGEPFGMLVVFKGKYDLQLLYPLDEGLTDRIAYVLFDGKKWKGASIHNRVVQGTEVKPLLSDWNEKLFDLGIIVDKDM